MILIAQAIFLISIWVWKKNYQINWTTSTNSIGSTHADAHSQCRLTNKATKFNMPILISISISFWKSPEEKESYLNNIWKQKNSFILFKHDTQTFLSELDWIKLVP